MTTVLSASARALVGVLERMGVETETLLARAGLDRARVGDPESRLPAGAVDALWAEAYAVIGDTALALHAAGGLVAGDYRVFRYLGAHSATLGDCLSRVVRYFALVDPRAVLELREAEVGHEISMLIPGLLGPVPRPPAEFTLVALVRLSRAVTGLEWVPASARLPYAAPPEAAELEEVLGPGVRFGQPDAAVVVRRADWCAAVPGADPTLASMLEAHADALVAELPRPGIAAAVRRAVAELIADEREPTGARVAKALGSSTRSLQRRLAEAGTTLKREVDAERGAQAKLLLLDRSLALAEVAFLLGFSDQTAFGRAFRRWTGESPASWRAERAG